MTSQELSELKRRNWRHFLARSVLRVFRGWNQQVVRVIVGSTYAIFTHGSIAEKKRVQCDICCKWFCDKGALKIHKSAVHLKEMHRCNVS